jgi:hypothetical protein
MQERLQPRIPAPETMLDFVVAGANGAAMNRKCDANRHSTDRTRHFQSRERGSSGPDSGPMPATMAQRFLDMPEEFLQGLPSGFTRRNLDPTRARPMFCNRIIELRALLKFPSAVSIPSLAAL